VENPVSGQDSKSMTPLPEMETAIDKLVPMPRNRGAVIWYVLGCAGTGFLVGYFAGLSESPVVATTMPLLFALLGGSGGLYVARADLRAEETVLRVRLLGISLAAFAFACAIGGSYGGASEPEAPGATFFLSFRSREASRNPSTSSHLPTG